MCLEPEGSSVVVYLQFRECASSPSHVGHHGHVIDLVESLGEWPVDNKLEKYGQAQAPYLFAIGRGVFPILDIKFEYGSDDHIFEGTDNGILIQWRVPPMAMFCLHQQLAACDRSGEDYSFYTFEQRMLSSSLTLGVTRDPFMAACRYFYLKKTFEGDFWHHSCRRGESPMEAAALICGPQ